MKRLISLIVGLAPLLSLLLAPVNASALNVSTPPVSATSSPNLLISALASDRTLKAAELYNQSSAPIQLDNYQIHFSENFSDCPSQNFKIIIPTNSGWLLPKSYVTLESSDTPLDNVLTFSPIDLAGCSNAQLTSVTLADNSVQNLQMINLPTSNAIGIWQHRQRSNAASSTRAIDGVFTDDYKQAGDDFVFYSAPLYSPPISAGGLEIVEILPHSRNCSPLDSTSLDCNDYVKLLNASNQPIDLANYRLRVGYKDQSSSITNTYHFTDTLAPGAYYALPARDDGQPLSITDSGGYVWLEDANGVQIYEPIIQYPDASSTTKIGASWAYGDAAWQWTTTPNPTSANIITPFPVSIPQISNNEALKPCADNQYRNPETNRCNTITTASALIECLPTQFRNPETNRCKNIETASTELKPCAEGQERNPDTNRCKTVAATASALKPCQPGWTRNPTTNRCRKTSGVLGNATNKIKDIKATGTTKDYTGWIVALAAALAALSYAAYEWRGAISLSKSTK